EHLCSFAPFTCAKTRFSIYLTNVWAGGFWALHSNEVGNTSASPISMSDITLANRKKSRSLKVGSHQWRSQEFFSGAAEDQSLKHAARGPQPVADSFPLQTSLYSY
ncbi:unnamed protein product, partial [Ixodes pacificus]